MDDSADYYGVLGVSSDAEDVVIRASYKALCQKYHPDKFSGSADLANAKMAELNAAYSVLSDQQKRKEYDTLRDQLYNNEDFLKKERRFTEEDPLLEEAIAVVIKTQRASISALQRHLRIGYNRAARLIEDMERTGVVSAMETNGNRKVLVQFTHTSADSVTQSANHVNWRYWGWLYLVWVVFYLIFANRFLEDNPHANPESTKAMGQAQQSETGNLLGTEKVVSAGNQHREVKDADIAAESKPVDNESERSVASQNEQKKHLSGSEVTTSNRNTLSENNTVTASLPDVESRQIIQEPQKEQHQYIASFRGAFGKIEEQRAYPAEELRDKALDLWQRERKILEPDGSINEKYVQKNQGICPIPGTSC